MANSAFNLVGLDFQSIRDNLTTYLKSQSKFADVDFEGSNISVLLDLLAYNTHMNSFYLNMVASEMFLDTAQLYDSVVSHVKELNYLPRSRNSAKAIINLSITPTTTVSSVTVPKGTSFTSKVGSNNYTFTTNESLVLTSTNSMFTAANLDIYEGTYSTETFVMNYADTDQRFTVSSNTMDTSSVTVSVYEDSMTIPDTYTYATSLFGLTGTSKAFFMQAGPARKYDILFGDNVIGRRPKDNSIIEITYRNSSGSESDGASLFIVDGTIDGHANISVSTVSVATGGSFEEELASIKFNAPRHFQNQERAITTTDYESILKAKFPEITAISAYGGEEVVPPQFGKVYISVDIEGADGVPNNKKDIYRDYIINKTPLTIDPVFVDPDFLYIGVVSNVSYNVNITDKLSSEIKSAVQAAIGSYSFLNLEDFNTTMRYSKLVRAIDDADASIVGNVTNLKAIKTFTPTFNTPQNITIAFNLPLITTINIPNIDHTQVIDHIITSSIFTFGGNKCILEDDGDGNMWISSLQGSQHVYKKKTGTVNYETGVVILQDFEISGAENNYIKLYAVPRSNDVTSVRNTIISIKPEDVVINITGTSE